MPLVNKRDILRGHVFGIHDILDAYGEAIQVSSFPPLYAVVGDKRSGDHKLGLVIHDINPYQVEVVVCVKASLSRQDATLMPLISKDPNPHVSAELVC